MQFSKLKKKLQEKLASHHIENENGKRQILSGESGIISILISEIVTITYRSFETGPCRGQAADYLAPATTRE